MTGTLEPVIPTWRDELDLAFERCSDIKQDERGSPFGDRAFLFRCFG